MNIHDKNSREIALFDTPPYSHNYYNYGFCDKDSSDMGSSDYSRFDAEFSLRHVMGLCSLHDDFSDDVFIVFPQCPFNLLG